MVVPTRYSMELVQTTKNAMKVLYLSAWYPTHRDAMAGLFVQKHAQAVEQQGVDVRVIYSEATGIQWCKEILQQWKLLKREWGIPDLVQMNVLDKNGLFALWLRLRFRIPYIIIEHWSGYLPENFSFRGGWHGYVMRTIAKHAKCILPVSHQLEKAMKQCRIRNEHWQRIHNVVDDFFFLPITSFTIPLKSPTKFRLLHVSCFDEKAKNIQGILRAVRKLSDQRKDFELVIVGTGIDFEIDKAYAETLNFPQCTLFFTGEQTPYEVAQWMQQSDAFVMFSRYENAPVVLSECLAVGLPIVSSNAGGIPEMISSAEGILVPSEDEEALRKAISQMIDHRADYVKESIQLTGKKYSYQCVGAALLHLYQTILDQSFD